MAAFDELKDLLGNKRVKKSLAAKYMSADELQTVGEYLSTNKLVGTENFSRRELRDVAESIDGTLLDYRNAISRHINRVAVLASNLTKEAVKHSIRNQIYWAQAAPKTNERYEEDK